MRLTGQRLKHRAPSSRAMAEKQVTIEGKTYRLPDIFCVIATQNPIEQYGTFHCRITTGPIYDEN